MKSIYSCVCLCLCFFPEESSNISPNPNTRRLISNLLISYFSGKDKEGILQVIANVLNFNFDQRLAVGLIKPERSALSSLSWTFQLLKGAASPASSPSLAAKVQDTNEVQFLFLRLLFLVECSGS